MQKSNWRNSDYWHNVWQSAKHLKYKNFKHYNRGWEWNTKNKIKFGITSFLRTYNAELPI